MLRGEQRASSPKSSESPFHSNTSSNHLGGMDFHPHQTVRGSPFPPLWGGFLRGVMGTMFRLTSALYNIITGWKKGDLD